MPRIARLINNGEKTCYHLMSRTALDGYPFRDVDKDKIVNIIKRYSKLFFVEVFGYCVLDNHFHLLVQIVPDHYYTDDAIIERLKAHYGDNFELDNKQIDYYRQKLSNLSKYMKEIKQTFSFYYNKLYNRRGTLWGERFKSVIVEKGETLINCLAYIDLNPIRAGIVDKPEDYRWSSLGYHIQTNNKHNFLSFDFGLLEFGVKSKKERIMRYRKYVYETGAIQKKQHGKIIDEKIVEKERKKGFEITRVDRFKYRTRYFTDSGIIGSKKFVYNSYLQFKHLFQSEHEKKPKSVKGLDGIYSLKRLADM